MNLALFQTFHKNGFRNTFPANNPQESNLHYNVNFWNFNDLRKRNKQSKDSHSFKPGEYD